MTYLHMATVLVDERHIRLVEWQVAKAIGEQIPKTQIELASELGVSPRTLRDWLAREDVTARRRELAIQAGGDPERIKQVMDAMFNEACNPESTKQTAAASVWAKMAGVVVPKAQERSGKEAANDLRAMGLSLPELQALLESAAADKIPDNAGAL